MRQVVQMANVIALELETGAVLGALAQYGFDILVGILEDQVAAVFQVLSFPFMLEGLEAIQHGNQAEIQGTHVQRGNTGLVGPGRSPAPLTRTVRSERMSVWLGTRWSVSVAAGGCRDIIK